MRELKVQEVELVSGGLFWNVVGGFGLAYQIADIGWKFYQGYRDGYRRSMDHHVP